jgi:hypothetical protein
VLQQFDLLKLDKFFSVLALVAILCSDEGRAGQCITGEITDHSYEVSLKSK